MARSSLWPRKLVLNIGALVVQHAKTSRKFHSAQPQPFFPVSQTVFHPPKRHIVRSLIEYAKLAHHYATALGFQFPPGECYFPKGPSGQGFSEVNDHLVLVMDQMNGRIRFTPGEHEPQDRLFARRGAG